MSKLELKIPPIGVFLLFAAALWLTAASTAGHAFNDTFRFTFAALATAASAVFGIGGLLTFRKARTTVNPFTPDDSSELVTGGVYRFSRNPMYLALLLLLLALGLLLSNLYSLALALLFVPYMNRFQIRPEERAMEKVFGEAFECYRKKVRRWV